MLKSTMGVHRSVAMSVDVAMEGVARLSPREAIQFGSMLIVIYRLASRCGRRLLLSRLRHRSPVSWICCFEPDAAL